MSITGAATDSQNRANAKKQRSNSSDLKGVSFHRKLGKWQASVRGKYIGVYATEREAHEAYRKAAVSVFGDFARFE